MTKFANKYRSESLRLPNWDYAGNGLYFITMVVQNRRMIFGKIENGEMKLSAWGKIAEIEWNKSFEIRRELFLDEFIIMPDHLHAIVIIRKSNISTQKIIANEDENLEFFISPEEYNNWVNSGPDFKEIDDQIDPAINPHGRADQKPGFIKNKESDKTGLPAIPKLYRKPESISSFVAGFKSAITTQINNWIDQNPKEGSPVPFKFNRKNKFWQPDFHDHIIRNKGEYWRIKKYIKNNPKKWKKNF